MHVERAGLPAVAWYSWLEQISQEQDVKGDPTIAITAKDVMSLRQRTGVGMMECKKALSQTEGDVEAAIQLLRETLKGKMDERSDRPASEGAIAVAKSDHAIAMIQLLSETDFTARNDNFIEASKKIADLALACPDGCVTVTDEMTAIIDQLRMTIKENISFGEAVKFSGDNGIKLGFYVHHDNKKGAIIRAQGDLDDNLLAGLCMHITAATPVPLAPDEAGLPADKLEAQKQAAIDEAKATGKPDQIAEKIATGKLRKWIDDHTLLGQIYLREMEAKKPIRDYLPKDARVTDFIRYELGS